MRPDINLRDSASDRVLLVVDTKWKVPSGGQPSSGDIKQMFCYHELFDCSQSMLLYPATSGGSRVAAAGRFVGREHACLLGFLGLEVDPHTDLASLLGEALPRARQVGA